MRVVDMQHFFIRRKWYARIIAYTAKRVVVVKFEDKAKLDEAKFFFEQRRPEGIVFKYGVLNWWDWILLGRRKVSCTTELR